MRLLRAAAHATAALTLVVAAAAGTAALTAVSAGAAVWDDDGGLVFTGDDAALPTAPTDVWSALHGRALATLGTGGAGPSSCVIDDAGEAVCTGWSGRGQLGIGTKYETDGPAAVATDGVLTGKTLTAISSGAEHACSIDSNGAAYCWGAANRGQVGSGTGRALSFAQISAGLAHTCAITADDGSPYCWGAGANGRLGTGTTDDHATPVPVRLPVGGARSITTGDAHTCLVTGNRGIDCWGLNDSGQLGTSDTLNRLSPTQTVDGDTATALPDTVTATAAGPCALGVGGTYTCWGRTAGFTTGTTSDLTSPTTMPTAPTVLNGQTITALTDDALHTCALTATGQAYCWGYGLEGELGTGRWWGIERPTAVDTTGAVGGKTLVDITAGQYHTCALDSAGKAYCWGSGYQGQLGTGIQGASFTPVAVSSSGVLKGKVLVAIDAGYQHTCALSAAGRVFCWGNNYSGQLGDGTMVGRTAPVTVATSGALNGQTVTALTAGDSTTCILNTTGQAFCWGDGWSGQVGGGNALEKNPLPVVVDTSGVLSGVQLQTISAGGRAVCAVSTDGSPFCWGSSYSGQLGNGSYVTQTRPVAVYTGGALSGAGVTLLGTSGQTWMVTEPR